MLSNLPLQTAVAGAAEQLANSGIEPARVEAELLAAHALGIARDALKQQLILGAQIDDAATTMLAQLVGQRTTRIPLQHLTGKAPFRYLELNVGPGVFIPRPETEIVTGAAIDWLTKHAKTTPAKSTNPIVVDLCTGSGAIAIAIATEYPKSQVYAVEIDDSAFEWAKRNIDEFAPQIELIQDDARTALPELDGKVDVVISNPPYVPNTQVPSHPEVSQHDPALALYGQSDDGLAFPKQIVQAAARLLCPGGLLVMEHDESQAESLVAYLSQLPDASFNAEQSGAAESSNVESGGAKPGRAESGKAKSGETKTRAFSEIAAHPDLTGRNRYVTAVRC